MTKIDDKRVPALRFKGFNDDWAQRKLKNLVSFSKGKGYTKNDLLSNGTPILLYGMLYTNYLERYSNFFTYAKANLKSVYSTKHEVVMPDSGETSVDIARASWVDKPGVILGGGLIILKPKDIIFPGFLAYSLTYGKNHKDIASKAQGKSVVHIHSKDLANLKFFFPKNIVTQRKICNLLEEVNTYISLQQRKLEQLKQIKKAYLKTIFSQNLSTCYLKDIAEYRRGSFPQPYTNREWYGGENSQPFVQVADVGENLKLNSKTKETISVQAQPNSVFVPKDTILVTLQGSIGRVAITQYDSYVDRTLLIITKLKKQIDKYYLAYALQEKFNEEKRKAPGGTIKTITKSALSSFQIIVPSYEKQLQQSNILKKMDNEIELSQNKLKETNSLKQFFLQNMFI